MKSFKEHSKIITVKDTLEFIKQAHAGQTYGNQPYWVHPKAVADTGKKFFGSKFTTKTYIIALLHDVIEDTKYDRAALKAMGYSEDILDAVNLLSKDKKLDYMSNIRKIISSGNKYAQMVKFADNYENYTGTKESGKWTPEKIKHSTAKYKESITLLAKKLGVPDSKLAATHKEIEDRYGKI